jgi:cobalamin biosynthesis protein CobW
VELTNGCICCTVADDFLPTMEMLLARENPPEHIVIETSGLALPQPLVRAFSWPSVKTGSLWTVLSRFWMQPRLQRGGSPA